MNLTATSGVYLEGRGIMVVGDIFSIPAYAHGCIACPHSLMGFWLTGSATMFAGGRPMVTMQSIGTASGGCGSGLTNPIENALPQIMR